MRAFAFYVAAFCAAPPAFAATKAFPGAEGFGAYAIGGRGGAVYQVTNLNDSGPGSLRNCVSATTGPRTCVFHTSGTIEVKSPIMVGANYLTIAGQTAPGGGIALRLAANPTQPHSPLVIKGRHDVIVRHIRLRPGPSANPGATDALTIDNSRNIIVDHVSMSWAPDENLNAHRAVQNLTVQWSIMAEGLMSHSKGSLTCSDGFDCYNLTFHHNLYAHNRDRNPDLKANPQGHIDFVNNVGFHAYSAFAELFTPYGGLRANLVGNTFLKGIGSAKPLHAVRYNTAGSTGEPAVYIEDTVTNVPLMTANLLPFLSNVPVATLSVKPESATLAYAAVLAKAGAWPRDAVDKRLVDDVKLVRGSLISNPAEVGGWPLLKSNPAPADKDKDGMPDYWEIKNGLDPNNPNDRNLDRDLDGYTELEEYLAERAAEITPP